MQQYLLRYGEIGTKSDNIRRNFVDILIQNIERTFLKYEKEVFIERERGRIFVFIDKNDAYLLSRIFGIVSYSPVIETKSKISSIKEESKKFASKLSGTFAVRARRIGEHDYTSPEAAGELGSAILDQNPDLEVDLEDPENEIYLEVRNDKAYIFSEVHEGPGGLPLSTQGKVASYIGNRNDFLATWLIMKRGARAYIYHKPETDLIEKLDNWDP
ncbi:MAG: THUMP domain-containing protein, partial [Thermoplasmatota archaeon]